LAGNGRIFGKQRHELVRLHYLSPSDKNITHFV
jgi:hypothetical protein